MRAWQRDTLVIGLAFAAGALDSWSYFQLAHVFIANVTGNTILFGYAAATANWSGAGLSAFTLGFYAAGIFAGSLLSKPIRAAAKRAGSDAILWPARVTTLLSIELALVLAAAIIATLVAPTTGSPVAKLLVAMGAVAEGLQSAALIALNLPGLVTTYIAGTWSTLTAGLAQLVNGEKTGEKRPKWERHLLMQAAVIACYAGSAALIGWVIRSGGRAALGWVPASALVLVVAAAFRWGRVVP